jgi:hypothetical protein
MAPMRTRAGVLAISATAAGGAALVWVVTALRAVLDEQRPATCLATRCFCEAVRDEGLAQPVNALTSLAYVALGLWALLGGVAQPPDGRTRLLMRAVGAVLVLLGLGSFWFHASLTFVGQVLDVQGMYLLGTLLVVGALVRRGTLGGRAAPWVLLAGTAVLLAIQVAAPESRRVLFALVLLPGIVLEALPGTTGVPTLAPPMRAYRAGVGLLVLAYAVWVLDNTGVLCAPTSPLQGHGAWHVLTAVAAVLLVAHYGRTASSVRGRT